MAEETPQVKSEASRKKSSVEKTRSDDFKIIYVNSALVQLGAFDFRISVGITPEDDKPDEVIRLEEQAQLIMSPQHAKALLRALANNVKKYEEEFGEINLVPKSAPKEEGFKIVG
jgi:hypothetical protein